MVRYALNKKRVYKTILQELHHIKMYTQLKTVKALKELKKNDKTD